MTASIGHDLNVSTLGMRAVAQLTVRTVATRLITLIGTIVLARLLSPEEFGAFAVVTLFVTLFSLVGDFGMGPALIQQEHPPSRLELSTAFVAQLALWSAMAAAVWLTAGAIPIVGPDLPLEAPGIARLLAVGLLLNGVRSIPTVMLTRVLRFGPLAAIEVLQQIVYFAVAVVLASADYGVWSFAIAAVVQSAIATIATVAAWPHWIGLRFDAGIARRLWGFGIGYQAGHVVAWGRDAVIPIFGGLAGGLAAIGILGFAWRNGQLVSAVEQIIWRVAFPAFSRLQTDRQRVAAATVASLELSLVAVCVIQVWIIATAQILVPVVFSDTWVLAVTPLQLVCVGSLAGAPTYVLRSYLYACGESRRAFALTTASLVVLAAGFPLLATTLGMVGAAWSFVLSAAVGLLLFIWATGPTVQFPWRSSARILIVTLLAGIVAAIIVRLVGGLTGVIVSGIAYLAVAAMGFWIAYPGLIRWARARLPGGGSGSTDSTSE